MTENDETLELMKNQVEESINHIVRESEELKGQIQITVNTDESFDIILHKGTNNEGTKVEDLTKDRMIELLEDRL